MSAPRVRYSQPRALLYLIDLLVSTYLPLDTPLQPAFRAFTSLMRSNFALPNSVAAVALAMQRVFAFRKAVFHTALARMDPRPPVAVSFLAPRMQIGREQAYVPAMVVVTVHFFTPDWKLVSHVAEFTAADPGSAQVADAVWNVVREHMPDPRALQCGVTAAANADSTNVIRALQAKLHELGPGTSIDAQPCFAHALRSVAAVAVSAFRPSGDWLRALIAAVSGRAMRVYNRCWTTVYRHTNPELAEDQPLTPIDDPSRWTATRDMYLFVHQHRAVFDAVLADPRAQVPESARPTDADWAVLDKVVAIFGVLDLALTQISDKTYPTLSRAAIMVMNVYMELKERATQPNLPAPIHDGLTQMLAKLRAAWPVVMTRRVYRALYLDPAANGQGVLEFFLSEYATEVEGAPCAGDAFQARWKAIRNDVLDVMFRTEYGPAAASPTPPPQPSVASSFLFTTENDELVDEVYRDELKGELDTYETLAQQVRYIAWMTTATGDWWRANGARAPSVARAARRVLCVPATTSAAVQLSFMEAVSPSSGGTKGASGLMWSGSSSSKVSFETARAMVVGRSLLETTATMGIDTDEARSVLGHLPPVADDGSATEERDAVLDLAEVRVRWEAAVMREGEGDGTGWDVVE
ncbi:hypothetical protein GGF31_003995 [Allomyces arbusculus]|nr:hypothetical protein GGF31_003995 [Allomyces arbusculus]